MEEDQNQNNNNNYPIPITPRNTKSRSTPAAPRKKVLEAQRRSRKKREKREERRRKTDMVDTDSEDDKSQTSSSSEKRRIKRDVDNLKITTTGLEASLDHITKQLALLVSLTPGANPGTLITTNPGCNTGSAMYNTLRLIISIAHTLILI